MTFTMKFYLKFFITTCYAVIFTTSLSAQTQMSIEQAIDYGMKHSIDLKNSAIDYQLTKAKNDEITGLSYPQINANSGFNYYYQSPTTLLPGEIFGAPAGTLIPVHFVQKLGFTGTVQLQQLLFEPSVFVGLQARKALLELATKKTSINERDIKEKIIKAYYSVLIGRVQMRVLDNNINLLNTLANTTEQIYKNGFAEKLDFDKIQVNLNNLQTQKNKIENFIDISESLLKFQMNMPMEEKLELTDSIDPKQIEDIDNLLGADINAQNTLEYSLMETSHKLGEYDLKRYKYSKYPTVAAFVNYGFNSPTNTFNYFSSESHYFKQGIMGLSVNLPIFNGFATKARIKQSMLKLEQLENSMKSLSNVYDLQEMTLKTTLKNSILSLKTANANIKLAQEVYDKTKKKYEAGVGSNLEIMQANTNLKDAENQYYEALYNAIIAKIDILKALNKL